MINVGGDDLLVIGPGGKPEIRARAARTIGDGEGCAGIRGGSILRPGCAYLRHNCHANPIRWPAPGFDGSNPICPARQSGLRELTALSFSSRRQPVIRLGVFAECRQLWSRLEKQAAPLSRLGHHQPQRAPPVTPAGFAYRASDHNAENLNFWHREVAKRPSFWALSAARQ